MNECFPLRFNLDVCSGARAPNPERAVAALFGLDEAYVRRCAAEFQNYVCACAQETDAALRGRLRQAYAGKLVAFFGDSITSDRLGYARIAAKVLPETENFAVSCTTSVQLLHALRGEVAARMPHTAVIFIGTNDACEQGGRTQVSVEEYEKNLKDILEVLRGCKRRILFTLPGGTQYGEQTKARFNAAIRRAAAGGCTLLDTSFAAAMEGGYEPDGVHLSPAAQRRAAQRLFEILDDERGI